MSFFGFKGGVHPPELKAAAGKAIETVPPPQTAVIPLAQSLGKPAKAAVAKKDAVLRGQLIGEAQGMVSANVHSSISGTVKDVGPARGPLGTFVECVFIESDGKDQAAEFKGADLNALSPQEVIDRIKAAGLVGMGGATFPTHVKLAPPPGKKIDTLIINGCECEPCLTADHRLMVEKADDVMAGAAIFRKALGVARAIVGVEDNKPDAAEALSKSASRHGVEVAVLHVKYPQGAEKQLIKALLNREVPSGGLPMDVGAVVQNVATAKAARDAVVEGRPLYERVLTLGGGAAQGNRNFLVRIGTPFSEVVKFAGGTKGDAMKIVSGGPMMGLAQATLDLPVTKGTSGILLLTERETGPQRMFPCLRCGKCYDACPMGLRPALISRCVEKRRFDELEGLDVLDCIECGCCAYECPANRRIVQNVKRGKAEIAKIRRKRKEKEDKAKAEAAKPKA